MLSSGKLTPSTIPHLHLNGAQSLQPITAYGLQALCLRLTLTVTGNRSRLDNRCGGSPLSVQYFQLLANKRLVAHQKLIAITVKIRCNSTVSGTTTSPFPGHTRRRGRPDFDPLPTAISDGTGRELPPGSVTVPGRSMSEIFTAPQALVTTREPVRGATS